MSLIYIFMKWITREHAKVDRIACPWLIKKFDLDKKDPALLELAKIVRGADTPNRSLTPQSEGLVAIASGFSIISINDHDNMAKQFYVYDALYVFCKSAATNKDSTTS